MYANPIRLWHVCIMTCVCMYVCMYVCMNDSLYPCTSSYCQETSLILYPVYVLPCLHAKFVCLCIRIYVYTYLNMYTYIYMSHLYVKWAQIHFRIYIPVFMYVSNVSTVVWNGKPEMNTWKWVFSSALNIMYTYTYMYK